MIDDRNTERFQPARNRLADAAHAHHADGAALQRCLGQWIVRAGPLAGAQVTFGLGEFAQCAQQQAQRGVGHLLVEHVRRVGDDDAVLARPFGVDVVVADAETRNLLELRKLLHEDGVEPVRGIGNGDGANFVADRLDEGLRVLGVGEEMQCHLGLEALDHDRLFLSDQQHVRLFASHNSISLDQGGDRLFDEGLECSQ